MLRNEGERNFTIHIMGQRIEDNNFEYLDFFSRKKIEVASSLQKAKDENSKGIYVCRIRTKKLGDSKVNTYNKTISVLESYKTRYLPITKTWVKLLVETEGSSIKIACIYDPHRFQGNTNEWYDYFNKTISSNDRIHITDLFIDIKNLTFSDKNLYGCVNPNNEFYTILIVTKN